MSRRSFADDGPRWHRDEPSLQALKDIGFYRLCDCAILAPRFDGESFPLTLVPALQVGTPAIATDVGKIRSMLEEDGAQAGIVLQAARGAGEASRAGGRIDGRCCIQKRAAI